MESSSFFFFQAEDGIRDWSVTGVQTCALPISSLDDDFAKDTGEADTLADLRVKVKKQRSEERRVGKECRSRWARDHGKKTRNNEPRREPARRTLTTCDDGR